MHPQILVFSTHWTGCFRGESGTNTRPAGEVGGVIDGDTGILHMLEPGEMCKILIRYLSTCNPQQLLEK